MGHGHGYGFHSYVTEPEYHLWRFPNIGVPEIIQVINDQSYILTLARFWRSPMARDPPV